MDLEYTKNKIPLINHIEVVNNAFNAIKKHVDIKNLYEGEIHTPFGIRKGTYLRIISPIRNMRDLSDDDDDNPLRNIDCEPFIDVSIDSTYVSCKVGDRGGWFRTGSPVYGENNRTCKNFPKGTYVEFTSDAKYESVINILSLLYVSGYEDAVDPLRKVIFAALNSILNMSGGTVELVGEEETINKILLTITNKDKRLINRHVLLYGAPGCGKSEIVKEVIKRTPEWIHYPLGCNAECWEDFVKSLDRLMRFLGKNALIIADEIDENGLTREVDREKVFKLLRVLDGVGDIGHVKFIATTNRAGDLDEALLRVGRLAPAFNVTTPSEDKRKSIIEFYAERYNSDVDVNYLCKQFTGASGATIRAAFENCVIYNSPLTTKNIVEAYNDIVTSIDR